MTVIFRTAGAWGPGKGSNLTAAEVDGNFWDHEQRIEDLETSRPQPDNFVSALLTGVDLTFYTASGNALGPVTLPIPVWEWRGEWQPSTIYAALDTFSVDGVGLFMALLDHTSALTFDPDADDGGSPPSPLYQQLIGVGTNTTLGELADVTLTSLAANDFLVYDGADWVNKTPAQTTALLSNFAGDGGAGGQKGLVPAPAAGDAAAAKFLKADGAWAATTITLGSTAVTLGSTTTTITGLTLSGGTLSGATTLPDSGQITSAGEIGLGAAPSARLHLLGTYTTANSRLLSVAGTLASSATSIQSVMSLAPSFQPTGASLSTVQALTFAPSIDNTALNIGTYNGLAASVILGATYSGVLAVANIFSASSPTINNGGGIATMTQYNANALTANDGHASGTATNRQVWLRGITAGAVGGTLNNRGIDVTVPAGGASGGTVNNRGIYITGNGGTASGGTVNNYAIYSDSTASSLFSGALEFPGSGRITGVGELGLGGSPTSLLHILGTYTTANTALANIAGTFASSGTGTQIGLQVAPIFTPSGGSLSAIISENLAPNLNSTAFTVTNFYGQQTSLTLGAGFSGVVTNAIAYIAPDFTVSGGAITNATQFFASPMATNHNATSGTRIQRQYRAGGITSGSNGATVVNRTHEITVPSGVQTSGTCSNYGIYLTGNGGSGSTNYAIFSDSTARSLLSGELGLAAGVALAFKTGTGARAGNATLVAGTVTVTNTTVTANTIVVLTRKTIGGTAGNLSYTLSAGASFTINSSSGTDTSVVSYALFELN